MNADAREMFYYCNNRKNMPSLPSDQRWQTYDTHAKVDMLHSFGYHTSLHQHLTLCIKPKRFAITPLDLRLTSACLSRGLVMGWRPCCGHISSRKVGCRTYRWALQFPCGLKKFPSTDEWHRAQFYRAHIGKFLLECDQRKLSSVCLTNFFFKALSFWVILASSVANKRWSPTYLERDSCHFPMGTWWNITSLIDHTKLKCENLTVA